MGGTPKSTRELYSMHQKAGCVGCHDALDDVGFMFESFDGAGRFRTQELFRNQTTPVPVDTSGKLINTDVNRPLANPRSWPRRWRRAPGCASARPSRRSATRSASAATSSAASRP